MNKLAFLNKVVIKDNKQVASRATVSKRPAEGADLRVYHTGAIFPSEELVKLFDLEYNKDHTGNGLDIFEGSKYHGFESEQNVIMLAAISRKAGRGADVFKTCDYDADTRLPKTSVLDQGATTFGKSSLIPMIQKVYGEELDKDARPYIDLKVVGCGDAYNEPFMNLNGSDVFYIPKQVSSGPAKGNWTVVRREKLLLWALVPFEMTSDLEEPIVLSGPVYREQAEEEDPDMEEDTISDAALDAAFAPENMPPEELGESQDETELGELEPEGEPEGLTEASSITAEPELTDQQVDEQLSAEPPPPPLPKLKPRTVVAPAAAAAAATNLPKPKPTLKAQQAAVNAAKKA